MHTTVLMPAYNSSSYISDAMSSVLAQTYKDWDLLVVNDGSTDNTKRVVFNFMAAHPKAHISMYDLKQNGGVARATRIGLDAAKGPLITVLDSDDLLTPDSLAVCVPYFVKNKNLGYAWTKFKRHSGGMGWNGPIPKNATDLFDALVYKSWWRATNQRWLRKSIYDKSRKMADQPRTCSDLQLAILMADTGCDTLFIPKVTYIYRDSHESRRLSVGKRSIQYSESKELIARARKWREK